MNIATQKVIAIDGREASGKGETSKNVARRLGFRRLDSGTLYRTIALLLMRADIQVWESERIRECVDREICRLSVKNGLVHLDGVPVGEEIRTRAVSVFTPNISPIPHIRKVLIPFQRACADDVGLVAEGRDMGSVVFPDALLKIFLTAHEEIRAARRFGDYRRAGNTDVTFEAVLDDLRRRDRMDERRKDSPLVRVPDAIVINTGTHNSQQVEEIIVRLWQERSQENST